MAEAEVTTSKGSRYRVITCFTDPKHLRTSFVYPARSETFVIDGKTATITESGKAPQQAGNSEKGFAFGHNFHAIHYNFAEVVSDAHRTDSGWTGTLEYGGRITSLASKDGQIERYRLEPFDTTPIELKFTDWRDGGRVPYRLELTHAGVTYDYRYTKVEFRC